MKEEGKFFLNVEFWLINIEEMVELENHHLAVKQLI